MPAPQRVHAVEPAGAYEPAAQRAHVALVEAPVALDHVPLGQGVEVTEEGGQKAPAGQRTGAPEKQ